MRMQVIERTAPAALGLFAAIVLSSCYAETSAAPPKHAVSAPPPATEPAVQRAPVPASSEAPPPASAEPQVDPIELRYRDVLSSTETMLARLDEDIGAIERAIIDKGEQAPEAWKQLVADLTAQRQATSKQLDDLRAGAREEWDALGSAMTMGLDALSKRVAEAKKQVLGT